MTEELNKEENKQQKVYCPCCGQQTLDAYTQPDQQTVDRYIACLLTGEAFSKVYSLYNGKITIQVSNLTDRLTTKAMKATAIISRSNNQEVLKQGLGYLTYRLLPIKNITVYGNNEKRIYLVQDQIIKAIDNLLNSDDNIDVAVQTYSNRVTSPQLFSNIPASILDKTVGVHSHLVNSLIKLGMNQSFYEGIQQG